MLRFWTGFFRQNDRIGAEKDAEGQTVSGRLFPGLVNDLKQLQYDAIIATYSLHHLTDHQKISFLGELLPLLNEGGCIYIGDVAFATRDELEKCKLQAGDEWDETEIYFVFDELKRALPKLVFEPMSYCAGILTLKK